MLHQLQHTEYSIRSLEVKTAQNYLMNSVLDGDQKEAHDIWAPKNIYLKKEKFINHQKTDFVAKKLRAWLKNPLTTKPQKKFLVLRATKL